MIVTVRFGTITTKLRHHYHHITLPTMTASTAVNDTRSGRRCVSSPYCLSLSFAVLLLSLMPLVPVSCILLLRPIKKLVTIVIDQKKKVEGRRR